MGSSGSATAAFVLACAGSILAAGQGATVAFTTLEAENAGIGGGASLSTDATVKVASSGRAYVHLDATGEYVQFDGVPASNRLTLRYSIPRSSSGTISLYINGVHSRDLQLSSTHCYDNVSTSYVRRYDELPFVVDIPAGATVRFQKDAGDTCAWYGIDLIDIENAPTPLTMPTNFLSIVDYGATAGDETDDAQAIRNCAVAAASQGKNVWVPPGTFYQRSRVSIPAGVSVQGAGLWHSRIHFPTAGSTWSNDIGFGLSSGTTFRNLRLTGAGTSRDNAAILFRSMGHDNTLRDLWIQNIGCIHGWEGSTPVYNNRIENCRVYGTYFDGVHWGDGAAYNNVVEQVYFRGLGDDAVAQVNRQDQPICYGNIARFNTVVASYWGRGLANIGGDNLTMTDNLILDCYLAGIMIATEELSPSISRPVQGFLLARNTIRRCGHTGHNHAGIHVWLNTSAMRDVVIEDNLIEYGETGGIRIDNTNYGDAGGRTIFRNNISRCNAGANYSNGSDDIVPVLTNNDFSGCAVSVPPVITHAPGNKNLLTVARAAAGGTLRITLNAAIRDSRERAHVRIYDCVGKQLSAVAVTAGDLKAGFVWAPPIHCAGTYMVRCVVGGSAYSAAFPSAR